MEAIFATSNPDKAREARMLLGKGLKLARIKCDEIQSMSTAEVARHKAVHAYGAVGAPVFVEDTGLFINGLGGFPGPMVKWAIRGIGYEGMCRAVDACRDRGARWDTSIALYDGRSMRTFTGRSRGTVPLHPAGGGGFGWDCIFIPEGHTRTFAEMAPGEKNGLSMRGVALLKLRRFLLSGGPTATQKE